MGKKLLNYQACSKVKNKLNKWTNKDDQLLLYSWEIYGLNFKKIKKNCLRKFSKNEIYLRLIKLNIIKQKVVSESLNEFVLKKEVNSIRSEENEIKSIEYYWSDFNNLFN